MPNRHGARMDIRHLRYFKTVAELGSFSSAARSLGIAQPALSRHVKGLEEKLGVVLVRRGARGVQLTGHGERLLEAASGLLGQFDMLPDIVADRTRTVRGRVVVGFPTSVCAMLARPLISAARRRLPDVQLHVIESLSGFLREWIEAGRLDMCVLYDACPGRTLNLEHLQTENLCLIGGIHAFPPGCSEIPFERLSEFRLALPGPAHSLRQLLESSATSNGIRLNVAVEVDSLTVIKGIAETDDLVTVLPRCAAEDEIRAGRLKVCQIVSPTLSRSVAVATSAVRDQSRACSEVRKLILEIGSSADNTRGQICAERRAALSGQAP
ncbi:MAG TPA: LysR family transcriptional regulator, partial [Paracoccaceae bacterium]|nr:LysR family transcriptional regulator [Paracoccaceae bacterium]